MNQTQFAEKFAERTGRTKTEAKEIVNDFLDLITDTLIDGEPVNLYGFGLFSTYKTKPQRKWNPSAKAHFITTSRSAVSFKAGDSLLQAISTAAEEN